MADHAPHGFGFGLRQAHSGLWESAAPSPETGKREAAWYDVAASLEEARTVIANWQGSRELGGYMLKGTLDVLRYVSVGSTHEEDVVSQRRYVYGIVGLSGKVEVYEDRELTLGEYGRPHGQTPPEDTLRPVTGADYAEILHEIQRGASGRDRVEL